jgi:osmoprotectant transport system permease protein
MLSGIDPALAEALADLPELLCAHVLLSGAAIAIGVVVGLPLALLAADRPRLRLPLLGLAGLVQTIPALALLALFYPLLLFLRGTIGAAVPALGFLPALIALSLYALLPILRNGVAARQGIDPAIVEAADGVGMTPMQRLTMVELPIGAPVILAGVRTAAVWTIGAATLATTVGQPSLGNLIFSGLQTENWVRVLVGCLAAAGLALLVDGLLALIESGVARRSRLRLVGGLGLLALGLALALAPSLGSGAAAERRLVTVGAKNFSEQYILAALIGDRLEAAGYQVRIRSGLGSAVAYRALAAGEVDVYVDYTGTLWTNVLGRSDTPPPEAMRAALATALDQRDRVRLLGALGFENAYALAMRRQRAEQFDITSLHDLARAAPRLTLASDLEFLSRPEWRSVASAYGLEFEATRNYSPTFMYRAIADGSADVLSAFSSDGRIVALDLVTLADPKGALPNYDAVLLLSPEARGERAIVRALEPLIGAIPIGRMREANLMVDRDIDKRTPAAAAVWLARGSIESAVEFDVHQKNKSSN